ncbi:MAG: HAD-IC family P-type ATPase [Thermoleophilia bacterium]
MAVTGAELTPAREAPRSGLTEAEAAQRLAARPRRRTPTSRSYASILRANVFTIFNLILAGFGALTLIFGDWRDALFLAILVANTAIGIAQEVRAKRALDRLALLVAPTATVVRDGQERAVAVEGVVEGDLVRLAPGDQVVADGRLLEADGLHLDESVVSGESRPVARAGGDDLRSGAFVLEGVGMLELTAVGEHSYAARLLGEARSFRHPRSPLERAVNRLLVATVGLVLGLGTLLGYALWYRDPAVDEAVATATAGVISLVPEGLVLLLNLTFAVGAVRMARRGVLTQQLNAIESLASADVVCLDKTGTLTESALHVTELVPAAGIEHDELAAALADFAASATTRNATLDAIASAHAGAPQPVVAQVPFASRRRWSALELPAGTFVLGAPERVAGEALAAPALERQRDGRRVVALARCPGPLDEAAADDGVPPGLQPLGLVVLAERLREQTRATVAYFLSEGVELKILSGDAPETVASIAADAGLPVARVACGADLPQDPAALEAFAEEVGVVGRVSPQDKRELVLALGRRGHHVAMVGDGVNDVPALKAARLAIAQGSGTQMAKSVADLVLVDGDFAAVPRLIAEGRQMLRNLQRVAKLYVTKSAFAAFLILTIGITSTAYPLLPRHFSLAATLTIGVPTFFLALAPSSGDWRPDRFARDVAQFAVPTGMLAGVGVVASYLFALHDLDYTVAQARTVATSVLVLVGLYLVLVLEAHGRRRGALIAGMCAVLAGIYVAVLAIAPVRGFFELADPALGMAGTAAVAAAVSIGALAIAGFTPGSDMAAASRARDVT